ncbi:four helix bundle protein [Pontibacter sp. FD36]|uniref:four helix bundle protein n=1 Tax=Pontibacter sp. FD36 TaxID=2789860 RepID=UPI0018AC0FBA|nr:four helix bundle protein [Pontibacter sp. FD36]MBF8961821.1 four helix bundle protein [Pontibacter sp. FD36]
MEKKTNIIQNKTFDFAVQIVLLCKKLSRENKEYVLTKQLLRSGTSIGANVEEAIGGISTADFSAKMSIAYKEAQETSYWLRLLYATEYLDKESFDSVHQAYVEISKILFSILRSSGRIR